MNSWGNSWGGCIGFDVDIIDISFADEMALVNKSGEIDCPISILIVLISIGCSPTIYNRGIPNLYQVDECVWRSGQPTTLAQWQTINH